MVKNYVNMQKEMMNNVDFIEMKKAEKCKKDTRWRMKDRERNTETKEMKGYRLKYKEYEMQRK